MTLVIVAALCLALVVLLWTAARDGAQRNQAQERQDGEQ